MPSTAIMLSDTKELVSVTGPAIKADGWYGNTDGLHTVAMQVINFTGRIHIEATIVLDPEEDDWFPIELQGSTYVQFPQNPKIPTGSYESGGDSGTLGFSFRINAVWLRARMDRDYLNDLALAYDQNSLSMLGNVVKVVLAR